MASSVFIGFLPGIPWSTSGSTVTFTGTVGATTFLAGDGTAAAPSYSFTSEPNTGMYHSGVDATSVLNVSINGTTTTQFSLTALTTPASIFIGSGQDVLLSRGAANRLTLAVGDAFNLAPTAFASLPAGAEGNIACVTDSNTATWGATIAGGGANNVLAFHNGTNWTVMGA